MKELDSFTVERLEELARAKMISGHDIADIRALARIALAAKRAEHNELTYAVNEFLTVLDNYPEQLVPINRNSVSVKYLRKALSSAPQLNSPEIPEGWKLVPIEPTLAMLTLLGLTGSFESMLERYANMLDAAPEKPL
ncbi:hypothetical protein [Yersinia kristensenii]|uniref:hypothetical protein n=1 Tax=Yersinia kristensenii TaxID=28152 RepID=UPI001562A8A3|nr:hypothetical protein [Yersinia kristensenii]QKJ16635.1 hypothetical protein HRD70_16455 [Yersinia kristensenii]